MEVTVLEAGRRKRKYWHDLWKHRELFYFLAWRDILVRYKQTTVGIAWVVIRPLLIMLVFTFAFGKIANLPSEGASPYALMVLVGLLPWQFFSSAFSEAGGSLLGNSSLITKVYFPRLIIPTSAVVTSAVDFLVSGLLLVALMLWYGVAPTWRVLSLPLFLGLGFVAALGAGLWIAALNVMYRDFRHVVPFIVQLGLYVSPVGFSTRNVPDPWIWLFMLNPMVGVIDGFRWALLGTAGARLPEAVAISALVSAVLLGGGLRFFRATERSFADRI